MREVIQLSLDATGAHRQRNRVRGNSVASTASHPVDLNQNGGAD
jgi:hypothetical protein